MIWVYYPTYETNSTGGANRIAQIISLKFDEELATPSGIHEVRDRELKAFAQIARALYVMERLFVSGTPLRPAMIADMEFLVNRFDAKHDLLEKHAVNSPVDDPFRISDETPHIIQLLSVWEHISLFEREGFVELHPPPWNSRSRFQELRQMLDDWLLRIPQDMRFGPDTFHLRSSEGKGGQLIFLHW